MYLNQRVGIETTIKWEMNQTENQREHCFSIVIKILPESVMRVDIWKIVEYESSDREMSKESAFVSSEMKFGNLFI